MGVDERCKNSMSQHCLRFKVSFFNLFDCFQNRHSEKDEKLKIRLK